MEHGVLAIKDFKTILYEVNRKDRICLITLNRPKMLNAFTIRMSDELISAVHHIDRDDDIRAVVVTGADKSFCVGADLQGKDDFRFEGEGKPIQAHRDEGGMVSLAFFRCRKPIIAAINGSAVGVGITMTLAMDMRVAAEDAKIGFVFARRGIVPEACSSYFLPKVVGIGKALEFCMTGRIFKAKDEEKSGLFNYVVPKDQVLDKAMSIAKEIASSTSAVSVALTRGLLLRTENPFEAHLAESKCIYWTGRQEDSMEGVQSFMEKRAPQFKMSAWTNMPEFYPWWRDIDTKSRM